MHRYAGTLSFPYLINARFSRSVTTSETYENGNWASLIRVGVIAIIGARGGCAFAIQIFWRLRPCGSQGFVAGVFSYRLDAHNMADKNPSFAQSLIVSNFTAVLTPRLTRGQAGGIAGTSVDLLFFPVDTIKTRLQSSQGFWRAGGFVRMYKGIGSVMVGSAPGGSAFVQTCQVSQLSLCLQPQCFSRHMNCQRRIYPSPRTSHP